MPPYVAITQAEPDMKVIEFILDFWDECMTKHILSHTYLRYLSNFIGLVSTSSIIEPNPDFTELAERVKEKQKEYL